MPAFLKTAPYYEKDGALRAYANRVVVLCGLLIFAVVALAALLMNSRAKPPLVIRVGASGQAAVVSASGSPTAHSKPIPGATASVAPSDLEKKSFVLSFVGLYWGYDEHTLSDHWSRALNMMTGNLEQSIYEKLGSSGVVAKLEKTHASSTITIQHIDADPNNPLLYHVLATQITQATRDGRNFQAQKIAGSFTVELNESDRTIQDPSGLLIAGFEVQQISSAPYLLQPTDQ